MNIKLKYRDIKSNSDFFSKLKYLLCFIAKSLMYVIGVLFFLVVIMILIYFVDVVHNKKSNNGRPPLFASFIIVSPSMVPNINVNDAVVIFRSNPKNLKIGDIITFSSSDPNYSGLTVTHRIIGKELTDSGKYVFRTKGDNNNTEDPALVDESKIYGKVFFRIPKLGYVRHLITTSTGFLILIALPVLAIIVYDIIKLIKKIKQYYAVDYNDETVEALDITDNVNRFIETKVPVDDNDLVTEHEGAEEEVLLVGTSDHTYDVLNLLDDSTNKENKENNNDDDIEIL